MLKVAAHILNRAPTRFDPKTNFELWIERKPGLNHFVILGCRKSQIYNPQLMKNDLRSTSCYFVRYSDRSKGCRFYCPCQHTKIIESLRLSSLKMVI